MPVPPQQPQQSSAAVPGLGQRPEEAISPGPQALMGQAQDMVALAEQFRAALARQPLESADEEVPSRHPSLTLSPVLLFPRA